MVIQMSTTVSYDLLKAYRLELDKKIPGQQSKSRYTEDAVMDKLVGGFASMVTHLSRTYFNMSLTFYAILGTYLCTSNDSGYSRI